MPVWPSAKIRRVDARLSDSRNMVAINSTVGKALKSSARLMNRTVIRIKIEKVIEMPRLRSSNQVGMGSMRIARMATTPSAKAMSPRIKTD